MAIPRHRQCSGRPNPVCTLTATSRAYPRGPEAWSTTASSPSASTAPLRRRSTSPSTSPGRPARAAPRFAMPQFRSTFSATSWSCRPPRGPCTPHAGDAPPRSPPLAVASPVQARPCPAFASSGLRLPRRCFSTQAPLESAPGRPRLAVAGDPPPREQSSGGVPPPSRAQSLPATRSQTDVHD